MNDFTRQNNQADKIKMSYPVGTRIHIDSISDGSYPNAVDKNAIVKHVDDMGQVFCKLDDNTSACVCEFYGDKFHKI